MSVEMNFDGLVGPTHNYAGLSEGNLASSKNRGRASNPRAAVLQGLGKMRHMIGLGVAQGVLPPLERHYIPGLRALGFNGTDAQVLESAFKASPELVANYASASSMWTANAATVSPGVDTDDHRVHLTPANLLAMPHRALEATQTHRNLLAIFHDSNHFKVHSPLAPTPLLGDEGAANHNRLSRGHGSEGLELFIYGRNALSAGADFKFPARQTLQASQAVARNHSVKHAIFAAQSVEAINSGAFHNDVVCVSNGPVLMYHAQAFADKVGLHETVKREGAKLGFDPVFLEATEMSLSDAVKSYVFNSQLVSLPDQSMALILPVEAEENAAAKQFVDNILATNGRVRAAHYLDLRQSMSNGGGPACLRLRVVMDDAQQRGVAPGVVMDEAKLTALEGWAKAHYRDRLMGDDLGDPAFLTETRTALDTLTQILGLGALYDFQRTDLL